jgi:predicted XRE-type DNA-binding protein
LSEDEPIASRSFESVWDAIEDDLAERQRMKVLASLMIQLKEHINERKWTQGVAAKQLGVSQPRISDLMRGKINLFSIDALVGMAGMAGIKLEVRFKPSR